MTETRIVKALNTLNFTIMVEPRASLAQATVFVSGDDQAAERAVMGLAVGANLPGYLASHAIDPRKQL